MMYLTWLYCTFLIRRVPSHYHTIFTLFSTRKVSVLVYPPSRFNPLPCGFTALAFTWVPGDLHSARSSGPFRLSSAWRSWSHDDVFPRPPDSVPWSLVFTLDFLPSSNPSEGRLILSPNRCLVHSLLHRFIYYPLGLSHQPSLPGLLQQPLINLQFGFFLPASFLCPSGSWPAVAPDRGPARASLTGWSLPFPPPSCSAAPWTRDAFRLPLLPPWRLSECTLPFLSRPLSRWPFPFIQISVRRGPLTTAYRSVWFSLRFLSFIHCSFLSSVVWGACHCLEGCLAPNRWILRKHVFEF